ncbi:MAG TPA: AAA family ATPase [Candidatus Udaeobacter sp.]|nr:AAA family ATPase [Candidatus Udaeobacter sp.]
MIAEDQGEALAFLADPATHGLPAGGVERIDTHISAVFLAGNLAYKLKRAVKFSYLDYSTRALRAAACAAELALNRRTAPELYLETREIRRRPDGRLGFAGEGRPIDTVVVMRRFDQDALFDHLAARGALDARLMRDLADGIAAFHREAEIDKAFGGYAGLSEVLDGNAANLALYTPALFAPDSARDLDRRSRERLERMKQLVEDRRLAGKVRLCHGDLHLRNICLVEGRPLLFDCIEFSRPIACVDVLYDLSFLLMDLQHQGLVVLSNVVFNRYCDREAEVEGVATLPLFQSIHAGIRAHVTAAARETQADEARRHGMAEEAGRYLKLASALLDPVRPKLVAVGGRSGSGKSTLGAALAPGIGAPPGARLLRSDVLRKRLMGVAPESRLPAEAYAPDVSQKVYETLADEAARLLKAGISVILDAVFDRPEDRAWAAALAKAAGVPFTGLWLDAPVEFLEARLRSRTRDASDATVDVLLKQLERNPEPIEWHRLDARGESAAIARTAAQICGTNVPTCSG